MKDSILFWLEEIEDNMRAEDFQRDFFESLNDQFQKQESLSPKQIEALKRIYERVTQ